MGTEVATYWEVCFKTLLPSVHRLVSRWKCVHRNIVELDNVLVTKKKTTTKKLFMSKKTTGRHLNSAGSMRTDNGGYYR